MAGTLIRNADVRELATSRGRSRAINYRERAAQLRAMAENEPVDRARDELLKLADQFDSLAVQLELDGNG